MEGITGEQKRFLIKWTVIMGVICGGIVGAVLLITRQCGWSEPEFWLQTIVLAMGGGYTLGFLPAVLIEYRRTGNE